MNTDIDERRGATSASNALADLKCPGRHMAQKGLPQISGDYAEFGNRIHMALASRNPGELSLVERDVYDNCLAIEAKKLTEFFGNAVSEAVKNCESEKRFWAKGIMGPLEHEHSARVDRVYVAGDSALIIEFKTLAGDIPAASNNLQLRDQAVLKRGATATLRRVGTVVIQPFATHKPQICVYDEGDLVRSAQEMWQRVFNSNDPNAPRTPGEVQCQYCAAAKAGACVEHQKWATSLVPSVLAAMDVPVSAWTPQQRAAFMERESIARKWIDNTKEALKAGLKDDPAFVEGYYLKPGARREIITDPQACFERFEKLGGDLPRFMSCINVGKSKLKEAIFAVTGARGASLDKALKAMLDGIVQVNQDEPSICKSEKEVSI